MEATQVCKCGWALITPDDLRFGLCWECRFALDHGGPTGDAEYKAVAGPFNYED